MSKRPHTREAISPAKLVDRVQLALQQGRSQNALELAKSLVKQEPTAAHQDLLKRAYLARGRELRERGAERDSVIVLKAALVAQGDDPAWVLQVAEELARSGAAREALDLVPHLTDPAAKDRIAAHAADAALRQGRNGRTLLPEYLSPEFDLIIQAFELSETGHDEQARQALSGLGLKSPFLDWKLLIRGLLAYYSGDDVRALENWQRLDTSRLPARLAAPLRQSIDAAYRVAQPPATQTQLKEQFERLQGSVSVARIRQLMSELANKENLAPAFRLAEGLIPELKQIAPGLVGRLAHVFYWAILETGPVDIPRYQRVFGAPLFDPKFNRMHALAYDHCGDLAAANKHWQLYAQDIAADPNHWPEPQGKRARALIWLHMGRNAVESKAPDRMPSMFREYAGKRKPLQPAAEACFKHAIDLAPDMVAPYADTFEYLLQQGQTVKAIAAAERLLKQFPDNVDTLIELGELYYEKDDPVHALAMFQRALRANPLERRTRDDTIRCHLAYARLLATDNSFAEARKQLEAAKSLLAGQPNLTLLTRTASIELKAGDPAKAEELMTQARPLAGADPALTFIILSDLIRIKATKSVKTRFEREFAEGLAAPPSGSAAAALVHYAASLRQTPEPYLGQKTHEKKIIAYVERAKRSSFTEAELLTTCRALLALGSIR